MSTNQHGGRTPYPLRFFTGESDGNMVGGVTPLPHAYFNPQSSGQQVLSSQAIAKECNYLDFFYQSDLARRQARQYLCNDDFGCSLEVASGTVPKGQTGGGPVGAPLMIPQFGRNPNMTGNQPMPSTQATTGFSYRFATGNCPHPFESMWGYNLPTFNPVKNPMTNNHM